jgi:hypothetical protein
MAAPTKKRLSQQPKRTKKTQDSSTPFARAAILLFTLLSLVFLATAWVNYGM